MLLFVFILSTVPLVSGEEVCWTHPDNSAIASGHALLQTSRVNSHRAFDTAESVLKNKFKDSRIEFFDHKVYQGAPSCVPPTLRLQQNQYQLLKGSTWEVDFLQTFKAEASDVGETAVLDGSGFKETTSACCPMQMEMFFNRLLVSRGYQVCSKPHVQGLMHWFTCVPEMDFQYVLDIIANGNPCKYWAPTGQADEGLKEEVFYNINGMSKVPDLSRLAPSSSRQVSEPYYANTGSTWPGFQQRENFAVRWSGTLNIDKDGDYTFQIYSDDGSLMFIDKSLVVNNDGTHGWRHKSGSRHMSAGKHAFRAEMFQVGFHAGLELKYNGPDTHNKLERIPSSAFSRTKACPTLSSECEGRFCGSSLCCEEIPQLLLIERTGAVNMKQPVSSIMKFDCTKYPGSIQVIAKDENNYEAKNLDMQTGKYQLVYTIPTDRTSPSFTEMNAVSINPIDGIAYGIVKMSDLKSYLVRFDEKSAEFVARLSVFSIAGGFSPRGTYYYTKEGVLAIRNVAKLMGDTNPDKVAQPQDADVIEAPGRSTFPRGADLVAYVGDLEGAGTEDEYVLTLGPGGSTLGVFKDAGTKSRYWVMDTKGGPGEGGFGAGWNFKGSVYFGSNSGLGVYHLPLAPGMTNDGSALLKKVVDSTEPTNINDGMNCMNLDPPFEPPEPGCGAGFREVQPNADGSCPTGSSRA